MEQSINYGLHKINLPTIVVEYNGMNLLMILDSGATDNYLTPLVYQHFWKDLKKIKSDGVIIGANGAMNNITVVEMPIKINGEEFTPEFQVLPNSESFDQMEEQSKVQIHGIIGTLFMYQQGWVIDYAAQKVYTKKVVISN